MLSPASTRACGFELHTQGSRTRPGPHAFAREYAGCIEAASLPRARGLALGYMLRPRVRGLVWFRAVYPGARGLALGYMLSPASTRARILGGALQKLLLT